MYALADELARDAARPLPAVVGLLRTQNIRELGLDAPATVPWWQPERRETTVGYLLVHMLDETAHHAGHADILRETIDGRGGGTTTRSATTSTGPRSWRRSRRPPTSTADRGLSGAGSRVGT